MLCGFCGTKTNPGFDTCPACGAIYKKTLSGIGCLIAFPMLVLVFVATGVIVFGFVENQLRAGLTLGILLFAVVVGLVFLINKTAKYAWVKQTRHRLD
jgi:hypothetical protein